MNGLKPLNTATRIQKPFNSKQLICEWLRCGIDVIY